MMPWKNTCIISSRTHFALQALRAAEPFVHLCPKYGISPKTGYKWLARYKTAGVSGMRDASRRPCHLAHQISAAWKQRTAQARRSRPYWGPKKLRALLRLQHPRKHLPSERTIARWLQQLGLTRTSQRRARPGPRLPLPGLTVPRRVHQIWTVDFKGSFRTADGQLQQPLTIREGKSRYLLEIRLLPDQSDCQVRRTMTRVFRREGLPTAIRVDNGVPFGGGKGALGLSTISVWWLRLGIRVEFTRQARPGDNAAHEQMHSRYKAEVLQPPAANRRAHQRRTDCWRKDYNQRRPHEALGQKTPSQCYRRSTRPMPVALPPMRYARGNPLRRVGVRGDIRWLGRPRYVGRAFRGQYVALHASKAQYHEVRLGTLLIGQLHPKDLGGMRPVRWSRQPATPLKVLPM